MSGKALRTTDSGPDLAASSQSFRPVPPSGTIILGHAIASLCVTVAAVAVARVGDKKPVDYHAMFLVGSAFSLRLVLSLGRFGESKPISPNGVDMSLGAAALFVSNALATVAALASPDLLLLLIMFSAIDVTGNWLHMVASAKTPCRPFQPTVVLFVNTFADIYLYSVISKRDRLARFCNVVFLLKMLHNVWLAGAAARTVVTRDNRRTRQSEQDGKVK